MEAPLVFVSYARADEAYVEELARYLAECGVPVWYDDSLEVGARFDEAIQRQIEQCDAFIIIMSGSSQRSTWVANETNLAKTLRKPILPILLDGNVFFGLNHLDYESVHDGSMPSHRFVGVLRRHLENRLVYVGREDRRLRLKAGGWKVAYSPDGSLLATSSEDGHIRLWNSSFEVQSQILVRRREPVYAVAWAPSGSYLAAASTDGMTTVWDRAGNAVMDLKGHRQRGLRSSLAT